MLAWLRDWRRRRQLRRFAFAEDLWRRIVSEEPTLAMLDDHERERLRELATLFIAEKQFIGAAGHEVTLEQAVRIASLASLPILGLGLNWYAGWYTIVVYATGFRARHRRADAAGLVHTLERDLSGEAWEIGPVVLSWADVAGGWQLDGYNVVFHEFAHKLDMLDGKVNGMPPLHRHMSRPEWTRAFQKAYDASWAAVRAGEPSVLDEYALEDPGEFFAVATEAFFELPQRLNDALPALYGQLREFYRQDPLSRCSVRSPGTP